MKSVSTDPEKAQLNKDYIITFGAQGIVLSCIFLAYKLAAMKWGVNGFAEYAIGRRTVALLEASLALGMGVAIPRYIALSQSDSTNDTSNSYFAAGALVVGIAVAVFSTVATNMSSIVAYALFGDAEFGEIVLPLCILLTGLLSTTVCYGLFRGHQRYKWASALQIMAQAILPLLSFFVFGHRPSVYFTGLGALILFSSGSAIVLSGMRLSVGQITHRAKELLAYGLPRVVGDFMMVGFLALPAFMAAHMTSLAEAGSVAFSISFFTMSGYAFAPLGVILLPKTSRMLKAGNLLEVQNHVRQILFLTTMIALLATMVLEVLAPYIVSAFLETGLNVVVGNLRLMILGILPFAAYYAMRSVIDALHVAPVNARHIGIALSVFLLLSAGLWLWLGNFQSILLAFVLGMYSLGGLTFLEIRRFLKNASTHITEVARASVNDGRQPGQ